MLEIPHKKSENLRVENAGTPCVPKPPYPSDLALLNLTLFEESRQFRPHPPFGYLTHGLINLEKSKSQFAHSWFKCALPYLSRPSLGFSPSVSCVDFLKSVSVSPLSKCMLFNIENRWKLPSNLRLSYSPTQICVCFWYHTSYLLLLVLLQKKLCV